jgi:hypothetical protein
MPKLVPEMTMNTDDDVEMALESQLMALQRRRHENARWWRNLNRWMISLGVVIIVIIVSFTMQDVSSGSEIKIGLTCGLRSRWLLLVPLRAFNIFVSFGLDSTRPLFRFPFFGTISDCTCT